MELEICGHAAGAHCRAQARERPRPRLERVNLAISSDDAGEKPSEVAAVCADVTHYVSIPHKRQKRPFLQAAAADCTQDAQIEERVAAEKAFNRLFHSINDIPSAPLFR